MRPESTPEVRVDAGQTPRRTAIRRLIGVYDAEGSMRGELAYWVTSRLGRTHCALCDITHGVIRERREWRDWRAGLPVPFDTFHIDDQPESVRAVVAGRTPAVVADTDHSLVVLLGPAELDRCEGSTTDFDAALHAAAAAAGLLWG